MVVWTSTILMSVLMQLAPFPVEPSSAVSPEVSAENRRAILWLFDYFRENGIDERKRAPLVDRYQNLTVEDRGEVDAGISRTLERARSVNASRAMLLDELYLEMRDRGQMAAAPTPAPEPTDAAASKKSRGAICWLFEFWVNNPIKVDKTDKLIEHYGNLLAKDRGDVEAFAQARIAETRPVDKAKADRMQEMYTAMVSSRP